MSRILDLYDWLYSSAGTMTVMFGAEGQDYRMDGADIVPLKTDADGNLQVASDLYPIMSAAAGFSYLANWPEDAVQYVNPKIPAEVREASIAEIDWFHSVGGKDTLAIPAVQAIHVPEKQNLTIDVGASWARFTIDDSGKSNEELYQEMIAECNANGYADAVNAITAARRKRWACERPCQSLRYRPYHHIVVVRPFFSLTRERNHPAPASIRSSAGVLELAGEVAIAVPTGRPELRAVAELFIRSAEPLTELAFRVTQSDSAQIVLKEADGTAAEAYELVVSADGVEILASHPTGFFYGLQSLAQLLPLHTDAAELPCLHIRDQPRFAWRGVLLDSARHFFSKQEVCTLIDTLARYKLNRLHWHLVDDQGWRLEIGKYPELADPLSYSQDDVREIVAFAAARGITVVPEIEMPGHSAAILEVMRELRCDPAAGSSANVYCAGNDRTFAVIEDILAETFALFPSEFVHIGGDEADKQHWKRCAKCRARMRREGLVNVDELQSYFIRRVEAIFRRHGRRLLGWDEIMDGGLAPSAAVMYWRSEEGDAALSGRIRQAAERGHQIVMTPQTCCYLDYHQDDNWFNEPSGWIGTVTLRTAYGLEPIPQGLAEEHQANILGAQGNLWCDRNVNFDSAGYQLFPRALALAEVGWSPPSTRDYRSLTERILLHLPRLAALRVNARYPDGIDFRYEDRTLRIEPELPGAPVHFTLNGTAPSAADPVYAAPIPLPRPTLVRAAIVRDDGTLGRAKPFMACDLLDSGQLAVAAATDSDPRHPAAAVLDGTNWTFWLTAPARAPFPHEPFPHEIAVDLGGEEEIAGFIYEPRTDGPLDGNILQYELCISDGTHSAVAASRTFSGRREVQRVILDRPARGLIVTLRILDAVGGVTAMSGFKLFRR